MAALPGNHPHALRFGGLSGAGTADGDGDGDGDSNERDGDGVLGVGKKRSLLLLPLPPRMRKMGSTAALTSASGGVSHSYSEIGLVRRVGRRLRRRGTFGGCGSGVVGGCGGSGEGIGLGIGSLRSAAAAAAGLGGSCGESLLFRGEGRWDDDARRLSSGEVLGAVWGAGGGDDNRDDACNEAVGFARTVDGDPPTLRLREL